MVIGSDLLETHSIVDKLRVDTEIFLHPKRFIDLKRYNFPYIKEVKEIHPCLPSLDSFQLKETINSPHNFAEEASVGNMFEQKRTAENRLNKCFVEGKSSEIGRYSRNLLNAPRESTLCETVNFSLLCRDTSQVNCNYFMQVILIYYVQSFKLKS